MDIETQIYTPDEIMALGMKCLIDNLGHVNALQFINSVRASCPDYTLWRRKMYDDMTLEDLNAMVMSDAKDNPFE